MLLLLQYFTTAAWQPPTTGQIFKAAAKLRLFGLDIYIDRKTNSNFGKLMLYLNSAFKLCPSLHLALSLCLSYPRMNTKMAIYIRRGVAVGTSVVTSVVVSTAFVVVVAAAGVVVAVIIIGVVVVNNSVEIGIGCGKLPGEVPFAGGLPLSASSPIPKPGSKRRTPWKKRREGNSFMMLYSSCSANQFTLLNRSHRPSSAPAACCSDVSISPINPVPAGVSL